MANFSADEYFLDVGYIKCHLMLHKAIEQWPFIHTAFYTLSYSNVDWLSAIGLFPSMLYILVKLSMNMDFHVTITNF